MRRAFGKIKMIKQKLIRNKKNPFKTSFFSVENLRENLLKTIAVLMIPVFIIGVVGFTDEESSKKALESQGFTDIRFTGKKSFDCESELFRTGFNAKNTQGKEVSGTVCCGLLKSCTVRW